MQLVASTEHNNELIANGCVPFFEVEEAIRRLVFKRVPEIPTEFPEVIGPSSWINKKNELRSKRIFKVPNLSRVLDGIVAAVLEKLIWGEHLAYPEWSDHVVLLKSENTYRFDPAAALHIVDPSTPPLRCKTAQDALGFSEFASNRERNFVFLDREHWSILSSPKTSLTLDDEETSIIQEKWLRLSWFAGATLAFRVTSDRKYRSFKRASEIARSLESSIDAIMTKKLPRAGTPQDSELESDLLSRCLLLPEQERRQITHRKIAEMLGENPSQDIRAVRRYYKAVMQRLGDL